ENLLKYTKNDQFLTHKNITLLEAAEKERLIAQLAGQMNGLNILDMASYHKNDGGSAGLKRYWLIVMGKEGDRELIEFKQTTSPGVGQSGLKQDFSVTQTPLLIWGKLPDFYGFVSLDQEIY